MAFFMLGENSVCTAVVMSARQWIPFACLPGLSAACILSLDAPFLHKTTSRIISAISYKPYKDLYR